MNPTDSGVARGWRKLSRPLVLALAVFGLGTCATWARQIAMDSKHHPGKSWTDECLIHRPCALLADPLPMCPRDLKPIPWPPATTLKQTFTPISVPGRLELEPGGPTLEGCPERAECCSRESKQAILVGKDGATIRLPNLGCFGDASRLCCNVDAKGQAVVATGVLELRDWGAGQRWFFQNEVTLCAL